MWRSKEEPHSHWCGKRFIMVMAFVAALAGPAWAARPRPAWVIPETLNVRSGPRLESRKIGTLTRGTKVYVIAFANKWCWVSLPGGGKGWIAEWLLEFSANKGRALAQEAAKTAAATSSKGHPPAWVKVSAANVRSAPGLGGKCYGTLPSGTKVYVLAQQGEWVKCKTPGGSGWICGDLLEYDVAAGRRLAAASGAAAAKPVATAAAKAASTPQKAYVLKDGVVLRAGPGSRFAKRAKLVKGQTLFLKGTQGMWRRVKVHDGAEGWVAAWLIKEEKPRALSGNPDTPEVARTDKVLTAWVTADAARVRESPSTEAPVKFSLSQGTKIFVAAVCGHWCKIRTLSGRYGWIAGWLIKFVPPGTAITAKEAGEEVEVNVGWVARPVVNLRTEPSTEAPAKGEARLGTRLLIIGQRPGWYKVVLEDGNIGWMAARLIDTRAERQVRRQLAMAGKEAGKSAAARAACALQQASWSEQADFPSPTVEGGSNGAATAGEGNGLGAQIAAAAKQFLGCAYVRGASRPGAFDCSGLTAYVHRLFGIQLSRSSEDQFRQGTPVARDELQPGDVVFFENTYRSGISHVGIYIGDGKFIHASNRRGGVKITSLDDDYYARRYVGARRMY